MHACNIAQWPLSMSSACFAHFLHTPRERRRPGGHRELHEEAHHVRGVRAEHLTVDGKVVEGIRAWLQWLDSTSQSACCCKVGTSSASRARAISARRFRSSTIAGIIALAAPAQLAPAPPGPSAPPGPDRHRHIHGDCWVHFHLRHAGRRRPTRRRCDHAEEERSEDAYDRPSVKLASRSNTVPLPALQLAYPGTRHTRDRMSKRTCCQLRRLVHFRLQVLRDFSPCLAS